MFRRRGAKRESPAKLISNRLPLSAGVSTGESASLEQNQTTGPPPGPPLPLPFPSMPPPPFFPYAPFVSFAPPRFRTLEGLGLIKAAVIIAVAADAVGITIGGAAFSLLSTGVQADDELANVLLGLPANLVALLTLVAAAVGLVGFQKVRAGRHEFGPDHANSTEAAKRFLAKAMVAWAIMISSLIAGEFLIVFAVVSAIATGDVNVAAYSNAMAVIIFISSACQVAATWLCGRALQRLVAGLLPRPTTRVTRLFFMTAVVGSSASAFLGAALSIWTPYGPAAPPQSVFASGVADALSLLCGGIGLLSLLFYFAVLKGAQAGCGAMIASRSFDPNAGSGTGVHAMIAGSEGERKP
jgi:hypothetical protein